MPPTKEVVKLIKNDGCFNIQVPLISIYFQIPDLPKIILGNLINEITRNFNLGHNTAIKRYLIKGNKDGKESFLVFGNYSPSSPIAYNRKKKM